MSFLNGSRNGASILYHENGSPHLIENHINGKLQGFSQKLDAKGKEIRRSFFQKGELVYFKEMQKERAKPFINLPDSIFIDDSLELEILFLPDSILINYYKVKMGFQECDKINVGVRDIIFNENGVNYSTLKIYEGGKYCFLGYVEKNVGDSSIIDFKFRKEIIVVSNNANSKKLINK